MLRDVRPHFTPLDSAYCRVRHAIISRDSPMRPRVCADRGYIGSGQFGGVYHLSARQAFRLRAASASISRSASTAFIAVSRIIGRRSRFEVRGVAARRIIASVARYESAGASAVNCHTNAVRFVIATFNMERAVPLVGFASNPRPAFIRPAHVNLSPKAGYVTGGHFWYRFSHGLRSSVRSVTGRWKRCRHIISSRNVTMWQGGVSSHFSAL